MHNEHIDRMHNAGRLDNLDGGSTQLWWCCRQLEDALDHKNAELIDLRKAALEHAVASPIKPSSHLQSALGAWGNGVQASARSADLQ